MEAKTASKEKGIAVYCKECGQEFESKRSTAKYCSDKCRKLAFLKTSPEALPEEVSVLEEVSVPDAMIMLTDNNFHGHKVNVLVPADWPADKKASALVKAKIPFYPKPGQVDIDPVTEQEISKYANPAEIW